MQLDGKKKHKERMKSAVCCNGDGSDKLPHLIIGKSKSLRCFKNTNLANLGCTYRNNANGWMTQIILLECLKGFDRRIFNRNVLLVLDKRSAHVPLHELPVRIS
jgi:hypothetical protein